jgi:TRAP-type C4-dicarboxylate transport system permease large subunit
MVEQNGPARAWPNGMNVFLSVDISKDVSTQGVVPGSAPFLVAMAVLLVSLLLFPDVPRTMK